MRDAVLLLLCALAIAHSFEPKADQNARACNCNPSEADQICEANFGKDNVLIAHENCDKFYKCSNGKPVAFSCPNNLLYNPFNEVCDWPHNVDCGDRPISEGNDDAGNCDTIGNCSEENEEDNNDNNGGSCNCNPDEAPSICAAEGSNGIFVAHEYCNQFYMCADSKPVTLNCPPDLLYNPYTERCDWPYNVECGDRGIAELPDTGNDSDNNENDNGGNDGTCNCNPEEAPSICAADDSEGVLVAHENCNQFYICNFGNPVAVSCPGTLLFHPYTKECDWPRNVDCGDRVVPDGGCSGCNDTEESTPCDEAGNDSDDIDDLPPPSDDSGNNNDNGSTCNCNPGEAPSICEATDSDGVLVAHENCNQFYKCDQGKPVILTCPNNLLYNPYTQQCDWPDNVDCGDRVVPDCDDSENVAPPPGPELPPVPPPGDDSGNDNGGNNGTCNCKPEEAPSICAADDSEGVLIAHENCNQFYVCNYGKPVVLTCPDNLLYNPYAEQCDWPDNVDCGDRAVPDCDDSGNVAPPPGPELPPVPPPGDDSGNDNGGNNGTCNCKPEEAPSICAANESEGVLIAHENCNQFYVCNYGKPVVLTCPNNLLYNPYTEQCDWPDNVDCGDRVVPDCDDSENVVPPPGPVPPPGDDSSNDNGDNNGTCNCKPEEAPSICAADDSEGVLIAHENCNQFYVCNYGKPVVLTCPNNLLYNPYTEQCDWPDNVDCGDRVVPDCDDSENVVPPPGPVPPPGDDSSNDNGDNNGTCNCKPEEAPSICAADDSEGVLIAHENCNQFYVCNYGKPVVLTCPNNLLYNPYTEQCDWPDNVDCGDRAIPDPKDDSDDSGNDSTDIDDLPPAGDDSGNDNGGNNGTCNCKPEEAPSICAADESEGVLIAHENCNQFYVCNYGKPVVLTCPNNLLYNPYTEQCDWPDNVDCGDRVVPDCDDSENVVPPPGPVSPPGDDSSNDNGDNNGTCNCKPEEAPSICAADNSEGVLIAHENCNQFYVCNYGKPVVLTCPNNLLYNPYTEQCDWPDNVDCGDRVIPDPKDDSDDSGNDSTDIDDLPPAGDDSGNDNGGNNGTCNCKPEEAPSICAADESEGVLIAHENCNQFYVCNYGKPVVLTCPNNLLYNPYTEQCDWPDNVDCGNRVVPDCDDSGNVVPPPGPVLPPVPPPGDDSGNDNGGNNGTCNCKPEEAPSICAADESEGVLIAHENCNQFYVCNYGKPVVLTCPNNLLYNPYTEQCDWPDNVDCGDRVIPDPKDDSDDSGNDSTDIDDLPPAGDDSGNDNGGNNGTCNCKPEEAPSICAADESEGVLIAHENCNQFYVCNYGKPVVLTCPNNLLYNPYTEQCDWPDNVDCGNRVVPDCDDSGNVVPPPGPVLPPVPPPGDDSGNDNGGNNGTCNCKPEEAPSICAADESEGVLIAHENCNQFYVCNYGKPVVLTCPNNLLYNPYTEQCDWPDNVDCGDRVIPDPKDDSDDSGNDSTDIDDLPPAGDDSGNDNGGNNGTCNCKPEEAPSICAADESEGVLIAHENCNQFYVCNYGKPVVLTCPNNLLYNPYTEQCDWPDNVDCGDRVVPDCDDSENVVPPPGPVPPPGDDSSNDNGDNNGTCNCKPEEAPSICAADDSEGVLIAHENCNQFYVCNYGKPVVLTCPNNLLYNPYTEQCDWPDNVDCGDRVVPDCDDSENVVPPPGPVPPPGDDSSNDNGDNNGTCNCKPEEAPSICAADDSEGVLIAHENCNQFYVCNYGKPVVLTCPNNLLYNPYTEQCDWPDSVDCGNRVVPDCDDSGNVVPPPGPELPPVPPPGDDSGNDNGGNNGTCNCKPEEAPSICAADESEGVLIAHENCNQFYVCNYGKPVVLTCPNNLLYNPYTEQCDWPDNVDCGDRVVPDCDDSENVVPPPGPVPPPGDDSSNDNGDNNGTCNCKPEEAPSICAADDSEGVLIAHENCNQFYVCNYGKPVVLTCPNNLLYNPYTEQCDWPDNVDCGNRVVPDCDDSGNVVPPPGPELPPVPPPGDDSSNDNGGNNGTCNCKPEEAPSICAADESEGVLIAHENCNQFYVCNYGKPVVLTCPNNLLYNPYTEQCDWPDNVDCGDRVIPDPKDDCEDSGNDSTDIDDLPPAGDDSGNDNGGNNGTCNCKPEEAPSICAADESEGVLIAHENCNQFYVCNYGKPVVLTCPNNLLYNPYTEQCDWPDNVDCGDRVIPDPKDDCEDSGNDSTDIDDLPPAGDDSGNDNGGNNGTCNCRPEEAPAICAANDSEGVLIAHENCNQFYVCNYGKPVVLTCPNNLLYNPYTEQCDWPDSVDCGNRVVPDCDDSGNVVPPPGPELPPVPPPGDDSGNDNGGNNGTCNCKPEEAPSICAADESEGVLIAHENCNQFYVCNYGKPVVLTCPDNLLYSPYTEQCDWPDNVDCGDRIIPDCDDSEIDSGDIDDLPPGNDGPSNDNDNDVVDNPGGDDCDNNGDNESENTCNCKPEEAPSICAADGSEGIHIAHENCNQFYKCHSNKPYPFRCPSNLLYNPVSQVCDWPFNVDCGDRVISDFEEDNDDDNVSDDEEVDDNNNGGTCNCNPEEASAICAVDSSDGVLIAHEYCNYFYQCSFGAPVAIKCPSNLLYNPYSQICDWPTNVECGVRVIPEPDEDDDDKDNDNNDNDDSDTGNHDVNDDPSQAPLICAGSGSEGVLVAHENCNQFFICSAGSPVVLSCSGTLLYNPATQQCDWPGNVNCGNRIPPSSDDNCACNPRNAPALCAQPDSDGKLVAHENCNQFYSCTNSVPVAFSCPNNLLYNSDKELCDWPHNVECNNRILSYASLNKHSEYRQTLRN